MRFVQKSNLPAGNVRLCAVGERYKALIAALEARGVACLRVPEYAGLPAPVACHADLQLCHLGGPRIAASAGRGREGFWKALRQRGFSVETAAPLVPDYPGDVPLNCAIVGKVCLGGKDLFDKKITNYCGEAGIELIPVKQGYAKCSVCVVDEHAIITQDPSIARAAEQRGLEALKIQNSQILLPGYDTGFIGGCSGLLGRKQLAFTGSLSSHPDGERIRAFLHSRGVEPLELTDGPLCDVGSILPLMEADGDEEESLTF